jgi:aspartyl-tRNA(Asn)/glutamyl-tRNA(Gln) amidotransferase subunit A
MSLARLAEDVRAGAVSPRELVQTYLDRIERLDGALNSFITTRGEEAIAEADTAVRGPLFGIPIGIKDVIDVRGARTTAASAILANNVATRDATVVSRLRMAGAVIVGKLNTHEFAWGSTSTSSHFGPVRNPWGFERICGGSSGGSGAAVASGLVPGALGTDTGGSIRIPSALCGVTGLRPSTGLVPTDGLIPVSRTFDVIGPMARSAEDCALLLDAIAGTHTDVGGGVAGLRVGVESQLIALAEPPVAAAAMEAVHVLAGLGARIESVSVPMLMDAGTIQQLIMLPEATNVHLQGLRTRLEDYGADVRARLLAGLFLPTTSYITGVQARDAYRSELNSLFSRIDVLVAPTMPIVAPRLEEHTVEIPGSGAAFRHALIPFNSPWSLGGLPVLSVPCGMVDGLPVGLAIVGAPGCEATILKAGHAFQLETGWNETEPPGFV